MCLVNEPGLVCHETIECGEVAQLAGHLATLQAVDQPPFVPVLQQELYGLQVNQVGTLMSAGSLYMLHTYNCYEISLQKFIA